MPQKRPDTSVTKKCSGCQQTFPRDEFYKNKRTFDGLGNYCRECSRKACRKWSSNHKEIMAKGSERWRNRHKRLSKDHKLRCKYGVPLGWYEKKLAEQDGKCAICKTDKPTGNGDFHVDHCHETGSVRGLLCHGCNVSLGHFRHSPSILLAAITYLELSERTCES